MKRVSGRGRPPRERERKRNRQGAENAEGRQGAKKRGGVSSLRGKQCQLEAGDFLSLKKRGSSYIQGTLAVAFVLVSCREVPKHVSSQRVLEAETHHLGESFAISETARCRVERASLIATEPAQTVDGRGVAEDLLVVSTELVCESASHKALSLRDALPDDARVSLTTSDGKKRAPSLRTRESTRSPDALVFEIEPSVDALVQKRRYDARTGVPLGKREQGVATLELELRTKRIAIVLRERAHDASFDVFLDALARAIATSSAEPALGASPSDVLDDVRALHAAVHKRFAPRVLALEQLDAREAELTVTLGYDESWVRDAPSPLAPFALVLSRARDGSLRLARLVDASTARSTVECADALLGLTHRVEQTWTSSKRGEASCNVLGLLLPSACNDADAGLVADILRTRARCVRGALDALDAAPRPVPEDFQLTLRRGGSGAGLDRSPRYVLALFANGSVVFHGKHWVSATGRSDGRTSPALVARLYAKLLALDWFERKGGSWDPERCSPEGELGNVLTLHAGERERMVVDRDGCRGPFSANELGDVLAWLEAVAGVSAWTTPRPSYADPGLEVWTVQAD